MDLPLILDIAVIVILLFFVVRGTRQGFVRALCSFLAVFVALFGAIYLSKHLTPVATDFLAPKILPSIVRQLEKSSDPDPSQDLNSEETTLLLKKIGLPQVWNRLIMQANSSTDREQTTSSPTELLASYILNIILSAAVFIVGFLLILLLFFILSRSLDLVAKLPILNFCNRTLGAILGLCKGVIILLILRWLLCDLLGQIPPELLARTWTFQILSSVFSNVHLPNFLFDFHQISLP